MNYKMLVKFLSKVLLLQVALMLFPLILARIDRDWDSFYSFLATLVLCGVVAVGLGLIHSEEKVVYSKDGFMVVAVCWIVLSLTGALPFYLSKTIPNFLDAFFESTSGFTTTGFSVIADTESMSRAMLLWRSATHWIGGMGALVLILALGANSANDRSIYVMRAESPGPAPGKLVPKLRQSAKILYGIYFALTLVQLVAMLIGGMPLFDSICIAMSTAGTGGFSVTNQSIASYGSFYLETVIAIFMVLFGVNFNIYYFAITRNFAAIWKSEELRAYLTILFTAVVLIAMNLNGEIYTNIWLSLRHSFFQVSSSMTTTGFATVSEDHWPTFSKAILFIIMFIGASAGSTAGGIKVSRIIILVREVRRVLYQFIHPRSVESVKFEGKPVDRNVVSSVSAFFVTYMLMFFVSFLIVAGDGFEFTGTITTVVACFSNVGRAFMGAVKPIEITQFSPVSKLVLIADMLLGRLEIYPFLLLLSPRAWKSV